MSDTSGTGQSAMIWVRDVLLAVFVPPLGLLATGAKLLSAERRRRFSGLEIVLLGGLFAVAVVHTVRLAVWLSTHLRS